MDVIGVGGIDFEDNIARFSSRGMTTWVRSFLCWRVITAFFPVQLPEEASENMSVLFDLT